ncbi:hypothetical protein HDV00_010154 [Rhizophlyctis rosea]|nr:hypothetical protein HDV00_010154 [Rhizophlyctis rosea]
MYTTEPRPLPPTGWLSSTTKTVDDPGDLANVRTSTISVVPKLDQFRRALDIVTMGVLSNVSLKDHKAIIAGGAVTTCLMPWPQTIQSLYNLETAAIKTVYAIGNLPPELILIIDSYAGVLEPKKRRTDLALFKWLHCPNSPFLSSDIDIFFLTSPTATTVAEPVKNIPKMHQHLLSARLEVDLEPFLSRLDKSDSWIGDIMDMQAQDEQAVEAGWNDSYVRRWLRHHFGLDFAGIEEKKKSLIEAYKAKQSPAETAPYWDILRSWVSRLLTSVQQKPKHTSKWGEVLHWAIKGRVSCLPTLRTCNSVSLGGLWPMRQTQLILPVTRNGEELVEDFDLDCVAVWWDGENVFASDRALRAFNTRTNFVSLSHLSNQNIRTRIQKHTSRGFTPLFFDPCACTQASLSLHRHDVYPSLSTRALLDTLRTTTSSTAVTCLDYDNPSTTLHPTASTDAMSRIYQYPPLEYPYGPHIDISAAQRGWTRMLEGNRCTNRYPTCEDMSFLPDMPAGKDVPPTAKDAAQFESYIGRDVVGWVGNQCTGQHRRCSSPLCNRRHHPYGCPGSDALVWKRWQGVKFKWDWDEYKEFRRRVLRIDGECYGCGVVLNSDDDWWVWEERKVMRDVGGGAGCGGGKVSVIRANAVLKFDDELDVGYLIPPTTTSLLPPSDNTTSPPPTNPHQRPPHTHPTLHLCPLCISTHNEKTIQNIRLPIKDQTYTNTRCMITGAEHGIPFRFALTLLKSGAQVLMTSEVPYLTARRMRSLVSEEEWWGLSVYEMCCADGRSVSGFLEWVKGCGWGVAEGVFVSALEGLGEGEREECRRKDERVRGGELGGELESVICRVGVSGDGGGNATESSPSDITIRTYHTPTTLLDGLRTYMTHTSNTSARPRALTIILPSQDEEQYTFPTKHDSSALDFRIAYAALKTFLVEFRTTEDVVVRAVDPGYVRRRGAIGGRSDKEVDGDTVMPVLSEEDGVARVLDRMGGVLSGEGGVRFEGKIVRQYV